MPAASSCAMPSTQPNISSGRNESICCASCWAAPMDALLIEPSFWCDYGYNIHLGKNFYANHNCVILDCAKVTFGDHVMVGPNCGFYTACHPIDPQQRREGVEFARPITVGKRCLVWRQLYRPAGCDHRGRLCYRCRQRGHATSLQTRCRGQSLCAALHLGSGPDGLDAMTVPLLSYGTHFSF